jgi:hypothetical protein
MKNPWSKNGIALYPPQYPLVGQNRIFNALHKFKQGFSSEDDLCGFFVVVGDWGLGKTRIGLELIAETTDQMDEWLLGRSEWVLPNTNNRILEPQLSEGILPLYIDYKTTIDEDLAADTWVAKVACNALTLLWDRPKDLRVFPGLLDDLVKALKAKGVDIDALQARVSQLGDYREKLDAAMEILGENGIVNLWVVVDEVETPGDLRQNPEYKPGSEIDEEDLVLIGQVIKEARYRDEHPYVNFLLLCSRGMSDAINIGPNRRRSELVALEPNHISDVHTLQEYLSKTGLSIDYPPGTMESVFIATNRNFGWFNKVMSSVHTSWEGHKGTGGEQPTYWSLVKEYANTEARSNEVFDLSIIKTLPDIAGEDQERLIFGQLPIQIEKDLDRSVAEELLDAKVPGVGPAFARLEQIHMDEATLASQLVSDEFGFKAVEGSGDDYYNPYSELSVSGVLDALRAFSISVKEPGDFVIYEDLDQFAEQLATLYPRESVDENKSIERAADYLHRIFRKAVVKDKSFLAVSFKLLKKINVKMTSDSRTVAFFSDSRLSEKIELFAIEQSTTSKKRITAICKGMAKTVDDTKNNFQVNGDVDGLRFISFNSEFKSPSMEGLALTRDGRVTVAYCIDVTQGVKELSAKLAKTGENVHPILVLFGPDGDIDTFIKDAQRYPLLQRSIIPYKLTTVEEEFLIKFSGRGEIFDLSTTTMSRNTLANLAGLRQELNNRFMGWRKKNENNGFVIHPIWFRKMTGREDFYRGFRHLVANDETVDSLDPAICDLPDWNEVSLSNFNNAAKKNTDPGRGFATHCMPILETDPFKPSISSTLVRILQEVKAQIGEDSLAKRFFFATRDNEVRGSQIAQVIEFLTGIGVVYSPSTSQSKAINNNTLNERRTVIENWLNNTATELIKRIQNVFPKQAEALEKGYKKAAITLLKEAEEVASNIDFSFLSNVEPDAEALKELIREVYKFDQILRQIAPEDPNTHFVISDDQIKSYQDRYYTLSFWEKVQYFLWLEDKFAEKRDNVSKGIDEQIADSVDFQTIKGNIFPTAPLTQPLRAIQAELQAALTGQIGTAREYIEFPDFKLSISEYLHQSDYDSAWRRLSALANLTEKTSTIGFWYRFSSLVERWEQIVVHYVETENVWNQLSHFMSDVSASKWNQEFNVLRKEFESLQGQIEGDLKGEVDQWIGKVKTEALIKKLVQEVDASEGRPQDLNTKIIDLEQKIREELWEVLHDLHLQALNRLLRAENKTEMHAPDFQETHKTTKATFEAFNTTVVEDGRSLLEGSGRKTNWELWVDIYEALNNDDYQKKVEHEAQLQELESLGLIKTKIVLT